MINTKSAIVLFIFGVSFLVMNVSNAAYTRSNKHHYYPKPVYCDTSGGRLVLNNGDFSKTYCRWTAVMNFQSIHDCCTWQGGVFLVRMGKVICRDGSISPICSIQEAKQEDYMKTDHSVQLKDDDWL